LLFEQLMPVMLQSASQHPQSTSKERRTVALSLEVFFLNTMPASKEYHGHDNKYHHRLENAPSMQALFCQ